MKIGVLGVTATALSMLCCWQWYELRGARERLVESEQALKVETAAHARQQRKTNRLEQRQSRLEEQISDLSALVAAFRTAEAKRASAATSAAASEQPSANLTRPAITEPGAERHGGVFGKSFSEMVSKMMKEPSMKKMMRAQSKSMMSTMYGDLATELTLTPEENANLTELMLDQQMKMLDRTDVLFSKQGEGAANGLGDAPEQGDKQIKALLGEEKFAQFQDYKKTVTERVQLNSFKAELENGPSPLQDAQFQQLLGIMREEREKNPAPVEEPAKAGAINFDKIFSGELLEKQIASQEQLNARVLERAGQVLKPEQLKALTDFQKQQLSLQKFGINFARQMFGSADEIGQTQPAEDTEK